MYYHNVWSKLFLVNWYFYEIIAPFFIFFSKVNVKKIHGTIKSSHIASITILLTLEVSSSLFYCLKFSTVFMIANIETS